MSVLDDAQQVHPTAQWWIKADGCDLIEALGESVANVWTGDEDFNDGRVEKQHSLYMERLEQISSLCRNVTDEQERQRTVDHLLQHRQQLERDIEFLLNSKLYNVTVLYL